MQQLERTEHLAGFGGVERRRVEAVVETLASMRSTGETAAELAHDARNMVTALGLYSDLLEESGVLAPAYQHYGGELRLLAAASRRLVEKLVALDARQITPAFDSILDHSPSVPQLQWANIAERRSRTVHDDSLPSEPIHNFAEEVRACRSLLAAMAGPSIVLKFAIDGSEQSVRLNGEDLTRILVNLVKNATEAMHDGGQICFDLRQFIHPADGNLWLVMIVEDDGPGLPCSALESIFEPGFSGHPYMVQADGSWPQAHRGLGLSITRSIIEAAGGNIHASNCNAGGARFEIGLPVRPE